MIAETGRIRYDRQPERPAPWPMSVAPMMDWTDDR